MGRDWEGKMKTHQPKLRLECPKAQMTSLLQVLKSRGCIGLRAKGMFDNAVAMQFPVLVFLRAKARSVKHQALQIRTGCRFFISTNWNYDLWGGKQRQTWATNEACGINGLSVVALRGTQWRIVAS